MGLDFDPLLNAQDYPEKGYAPKRFRWPATKLTWLWKESVNRTLKSRLTL
jgi:hypothetical protein